MYDDDDGAERITFSAKNRTKDVHREVELRIRERMSADANLTFHAASKLVFRADPALHVAYLDTPPPLHPPRRRYLED